VQAPSFDQESHQSPPGQSASPIFVVSMWRSGSSLLYALLNKHPQVGLMYEADLILLRSVFVKSRRFCDWARRWQFWDKAFTRHNLDPDEFARMQIGDFPTAFAAVHTEFARRKGATIWGDKSPNYYDRLRYLSAVFPHAKFIIVWRDPLGTANSIARAAATGNHYFKRKGAALRGLIGYGIFKQQVEWLRTNGRLVHELSYEDLTADTVRVMQSVCGFLQIAYSDDLANLQGADRSAIFDGQHHAFVKGEKIVSGPRPSVLSERFRAKTNRYLAFWRSRYAGNWPPYPLPDGSNAERAGLLERTFDKLAYLGIRGFEAFTRLCFCMVPLSWLERYRNEKYRAIVSNPGGDSVVAPGTQSNPIAPKEA
jgi:Sulfotransferase family